MSLYTIADLHLSTLPSTNKSMEVFGRRWDNYMERLAANWRHLITDDDTVVIPGDISWAISLSEATSDFLFLSALPGKKIIGKGNHDFWWATMNKHREFFDKNNISNIEFLFNNAHVVEDFIVAGTRGWFFDEDAMTVQNNADFDKIVNRENGRLKASLDSAHALSLENPGKETVVFMHFPPYRAERAVDSTVSILKEYGVKRVYYGHIHGSYSDPPYEIYEGIKFQIISADYLGFTPLIVAR